MIFLIDPRSHRQLRARETGLQRRLQLFQQRRFVLVRAELLAQRRIRVAAGAALHLPLQNGDLLSATRAAVQIPYVALSARSMR